MNSRNRKCGCNMANQANMNNSNNGNSNNDDNDKCSCGFRDQNVFPINYMYGQSYVPIQYMDQTFRPNVGLQMGTIFPELVDPYTPGQSMAEDAYLRRATQNEGQCPNSQR